MQRLVIEVDDKYINLVTDLLSNMKQNVIKSITIEKQQQRSRDYRLKKFKELKNSSNNRKVLTQKLAIDTKEMINDNIL